MVTEEIDYKSPRYFVNFAKEWFVKDAKEMGRIRKEYHEIIPSKCECGTDLVISYNLRTMRCPNLRCSCKIPYAMSDMLSNFGIKNAGFSFCYEIMKYRPQWKTHLAILAAKLEDYSPNISPIYTNQVFNDIAMLRVKSTEMTLKEFVSKLELPKIKESSYKLFKGIDTSDEIVEAWTKVCEDGQRMVSLEKILDFVCEKMDQYGDNSSNMAYILYDIAPALINILRRFVFKKDGDIHITVAITGNIWRESPMHRDDFARYVSNITNGKVSVRIGKALASCDYIIADDESNSRTYRAGVDRGVLITSKDFCDKVRCL